MVTLYTLTVINEPEIVLNSFKIIPFFIPPPFYEGGILTRLILKFPLAFFLFLFDVYIILQFGIKSKVVII